MTLHLQHYVASGHDRLSLAHPGRLAAEDYLQPVLGRAPLLADCALAKLVVFQMQNHQG